MEETFILVKPDGVQRNLGYTIETYFRSKGFTLVEKHTVTPSLQLAQQHYEEHAGKPFYETITHHLSSGPVLLMIWSGENAIALGRQTAMNIRQQFKIPGSPSHENVIHSSDAFESAQREIKLWRPLMFEAKLKEATMEFETKIAQNM